MNCQRFESIVNDLAREQIIEAFVRDLALAHCEECQSCALKLEDQRALTVGLRGLAAAMESMEAPARVEERLLAALANRTLALPRRLTTRPWRYWISAAAAVLLIVFGTAARRWYVAPHPDEAAKISEIVQAVVIPEAPRSVLPQPSGAPSAKQKRLLVSPKKSQTTNVEGGQPRPLDRDGSVAPVTTTVEANYGSGEMATGFLPVGSGSTLNLQDGGQIVRVELPRRALANFGLPVNMNRANERVKADVLLSSDGLAQAIRFVH
jgi:hypothetical protein